MKTELLRKVAANLTSYGQFMGSKWGNDEAETMAVQTIRSCAFTLKKNGEPFSWLMDSATEGRVQCGTNNARGLKILVDDGCVEIQDYSGTATPPDGVVIRNGKPQVLVVTDKMLLYAASLVDVKLD